LSSVQGVVLATEPAVPEEPAELRPVLEEPEVDAPIPLIPEVEEPVAPVPLISVAEEPLAPVPLIPLAEEPLDPKVVEGLEAVPEAPLPDGEEALEEAPLTPELLGEELPLSSAIARPALSTRAKATAVKVCFVITYSLYSVGVLFGSVADSRTEAPFGRLPAS